MRKTFRKNKTELAQHWKNYLFQSLFATVSVFLILIILKFSNAIVIASIGATVFIVFAMPNSVSARPRSIIGGHLTGLLVGSLISLIPFSSFYIEILILAASVGISMFIMVMIDCEHPPACGTALGIALIGFSWEIAFAVVIFSILLAAIHDIFKNVIRDLV
ncbi:MAG: HPP family protein [Candidatus Cloacimonetes bacterium]|nr:HPP family protein [Candidatus Cloacimonadota bacterium]